MNSFLLGFRFSIMRITRLPLQRRNPTIQFMFPQRSKYNTVATQYYKQRIAETWERSTTLWSCSCWTIMSHTVVFPDAVPPETPDPRWERKSN